MKEGRFILVSGFNHGHVAPLFLTHFKVQHLRRTSLLELNCSSHCIQEAERKQEEVIWDNTPFKGMSLIIDFLQPGPTPLCLYYFPAAIEAVSLSWVDPLMGSGLL